MDYETYLLAEWNGFFDDPKRARAAMAVIANRRVDGVLDVGCGAGQELVPFAQHRALCVGIDPSRQVGRAPWRPEHGQVSFVRGIGERLPFPNACFDVVICRTALPFMDNRAALREMSRVLRPDGLLLLKLVSAPFYLRELRRGAVSLDVRRCIHAVHVLVTGAIYHALGVQVRTIVTRTTFQSEWMLKRELRRLGMHIAMRMPDDARVGPSLGIERDETQQS